MSSEAGVTFAAGRRLGPYEIVALAGAGGMGQVYRAMDTRLNRTVAIKILGDRVVNSPGIRERFAREARTISSLNHPHICVLHDIGTQDGIDYLVMEYLEGETLAQRLRRGAMPVAEALRHAASVADALHDAHRTGISHRDLKPGNIMLTKSGAKLMDFGLARLSQSETNGAETTIDLGLTQEGAVLGTPQYMSPEQIEGKEADTRSDIFAFGAILYEMIAGKKAFEGQTAQSVVSAILAKEPAPVSAIQPGTHPALERLINVCLAKDPEQRWQNARDLQLQLESLADLPTEQVRAKQPSMVPLLGWVVASLLLLAAAGLWCSGRWRPHAARASVRASLLPPPSVSFEPYHFGISPDGNRLAFVGVGQDGRPTLWVRGLESRAVQQLTGTNGARYPFWAPDNRRIGFFAEGKLKLVDTANGVVQVLCDSQVGAGGTWNREGTIVFASSPAGTLFRISDRGGRPVRTTRTEPGLVSAHRWPWFLPDGKHFLYFNHWAAAGNPEPNGIYIGSLDDSKAKLISTEIRGSVAFVSGHLLYFQDRNLLAQPFDPEAGQVTGAAVPILQEELHQDAAFLQVALSASLNGTLVFQSISDYTSEMLWLSKDGKQEGRIDGNGLKDPNLSPDGRFVALSGDEAQNGRRSIYVYDLQRNVRTKITDGGNDEFPLWSPDGRKIAFTSVEGRTGVLSEVASDGSGKPTVLLRGAHFVPNDYTPDGRGLLYMTFEKIPAVLGVYDTVSRTSQLHGPGAEFKLSPDGKWLLTGFGLQIQPFPNGGPRLAISNAAGAQSRWSHDGKRIYYISPDRKLMETSIDYRAGQVVPGVPCPLFQTQIAGANFVLFQYDVSTDGNRFLVNSLRPESPLTVVADWTVELSK